MSGVTRLLIVAHVLANLMTFVLVVMTSQIGMLIDMALPGGRKVVNLPMLVTLSVTDHSLLTFGALFLTCSLIPVIMVLRRPSSSAAQRLLLAGPITEVCTTLLLFAVAVYAHMQVRG